MPSSTSLAASLLVPALVLGLAPQDRVYPGGFFSRPPGGFGAPPAGGLRDRSPRLASCVLAGTTEVSGVVSLFQQAPHEQVRISGQISGLSPGFHGFHVHSLGDLSNGCASTGSHYNPGNFTHGGPLDEQRHVGDLGNVEANREGIAFFDFSDRLVQLYGPFSVLGRALVVHAKEDDLGRGGNQESSKTGNAGARLACCVIGRALMTA